MAKKSILLAFSGGLDTSFCVKYLSEDMGFDVYSVTVNTGGFTREEMESIKQKALSLGVVHHENIDMSNQYYQQCIRYLVFGNVLRYKTYPVSVSSERTFQAVAVVQHARENGIKYLAHGSTGAGNDQVRFEMMFHILASNLEIIAPIRELRISREEELAYLRKKGIDVSGKQFDYSINKGMWGTTIGGRETLTSCLGLPEGAFPNKLTQGGMKKIELEFINGEIKGGIETIREINELCSSFAIGRGVHVGDTILGIKGRVGFEAPAPIIIIQAHQLLEKHVLSKWQMYWKDQLAEWYGMLLHEGHYLDPVMRNIEKFMVDSQSRVTGKVFVKLRPYCFEIEGIDSKFDLMQATKAKYGEENTDWSGEDVKGFTKIISNPLKIFYSVYDKNNL